MKKFLGRVGCIAAIVLCTAAALELAARRIPSSYSEKADYMERHADSIRVLVLGSSHAYTGIDPEVLGGNAYSLANFSQTVYYDYRLLRKYADRCPNLQRVIMTVSAFSLYSDLEDGDEKSKLVWYSDYFGIDRYPWSARCRFQIVSDPANLLHRIKAHYLRAEDQVCMTPQGMSTLYTLDNKDMRHWDDGAAAAKRHHSSMPPKGTIVEDLNRMAELCYDRHIELYLVGMPARASYRDNGDPVQARHTRLVIDSILHRYPNVSYLDYSADSALTADSDLFYDADHLSSYGAGIFTRRLRSRIGGGEP